MHSFKGDVSQDDGLLRNSKTALDCSFKGDVSQDDGLLRNSKTALRAVKNKVMIAI